MNGQRTGRRACCRVLRNAVCRREHARLPALARAGEAVDARVEASERPEVGRETRHLLLAAQLQEDVLGPEVVELDRQTRAHSEYLLQLLSAAERLKGRDRLLHPAEDDARTFAFEGHGHDAGARL